MEGMTQAPLGVRTRARAQAMQKELIRNNSCNDQTSTGTTMQSFVPAQISYLELRSRRLEKVVGCMSNKMPSTRKTTSAGECRRLSDLTNSDILADDSSSRLALSVDEARHTRRQTRHQISDENQECIYHFHGDSEAEESSLQGFVQRSLQQWTSRGRAPPGVAHSRSNSRSNSVTRELPPPTRELPPRGILTRNRRKLEKQTSEANAFSSKVDDMEVQVDGSCSAKACGLARTCDVEVSFGENPVEEGWSGGNRLTHEGTPSSKNREGNTLSSAANAKMSARLQCTTHRERPSPSIMHSSLDMEIEDFFVQAEGQVQRHFIERYNFDPKNDTPLPGRYDWVEL